MIVTQSPYQEIDESINFERNHYDWSAKRNKFYAFSLRIGTAFLSAAATVFLGFQVSTPSTTLHNFALICTAIVTVVNTCDAFLKPRPTWINSQKTVSLLDDLQRDLHFTFKGKNTDEVSATELDRFKTELGNILRTQRQSWLETLQETTPESKS